MSDHTLRIAQIAPPDRPVSPGGDPQSRIIHDLCAALAAGGHDVSLFASADSQLPRRVRLCPWWTGGATGAWPPTAESAALRDLAGRAEGFDVLHLHADDGRQFAAAGLLPRPVVLTIHGPEHAGLREFAASTPVLTCSDAGREFLPATAPGETIAPGLLGERYPVRAGRRAPDGPLVWIGRLGPGCGLEAAIAAARSAGRTLKVFGSWDRSASPQERAGVERLLHRSPWAERPGRAGEADKVRTLSRAAALVWTAGRSDSAGLAMIEALACGTPVIALRRGCAAERVLDGVTGFLVPDAAEAAAAVRRAACVDRRACREDFERRFEAARSAEAHVALYRRMIGSVPRVRSAPDPRVGIDKAGWLGDRWFDPGTGL